ncbi:MAG: right-handed parallel beta-helix repeat-containing protein [Clostridia bacterium]|nr:right-handed parallel beta-helix repeat-containing protein [Clostridia bacterium]
MDMFFAKIVSFITAIFTMFSLIFNPAEPVEGEFDEVTPAVKQAFDEGEFTMGEYDIVVSPDGNDSNNGSLENPLKTFEAAKEKLKAIKLGDVGTITVWFREGTYTIKDTVEFTSADRKDVLYRSYPGEEVIFSGAKKISGSWSETTVNGVRAFVTDMPIKSEEDYFHSLFKDGKRLSRSNYPKQGVFKIADPIIEEGVPSDWSPEFFTHTVAFVAHTKDLLSFTNINDVDVRVMHYWCDELLPIHSVNTSTGRIEVSKVSSMTLRVDDNYIFENVKEALSLPGEWYLDRSEEKLYYIPQEGDTVDNTVLCAGGCEQLVTLDGVENISFRGINFENTDWTHVDGAFFDESMLESSPMYGNIKYGGVHPQAAFEIPAAIYVTASSGVNFTDCRFENISYTAVKFDKASTDCDITSCYFNEIGANAVFIHGDAVVPANTQRINVTDCHISNYGRIFNNAIGVLLTHAIDCNITNNEIHDGWYTGVSVGWNWGYAPNPTNGIKICDNLIYNIGNGWLSDMGGIYTLGIQPDSVISGNIIHDVGCDEGAYGYGGWGIYLDEGSSGMLVENNLVYDCSSQTFHQHYGKDNIIRNNIFAFGGEGAFIISRHEEHNSLTLTNNILVTDNAPMYARTIESNWFVDDSNLYWDYANGGNVTSGYSMKLVDKKSIPLMVARGYYNNAVFADPVFKDAQNRDFTLAKNSPALETGFTPWVYSAGTKTLFN